jgi:hypothetical protein
MRRKSSNRTSGLWPTPNATDATLDRTPERHYERQAQLKAVNPNLGELQKPLIVAIQEFTPPSETLTEPDTEEQLYLPEGFLASHFPRPGSAEARKMTVTSGLKCSGLYHKPGPLGSLVKMLLESSAWNSTECFLTWKVKATPSNRLLFQLAPSMPNTDGTEFGLWATPKNRDFRSAEGGAGEMRDSPDLNVQVKMWPTPQARDKETIAKVRRGADSPGGTPLAVAAYDSQPIVSPQGGSLNPTWVCWLMGYPLDWFDKVKNFASGRRSRKLAELREGLRTGLTNSKD